MFAKRLKEQISALAVKNAEYMERCRNLLLVFISEIQKNPNIELDFASPEVVEGIFELRDLLFQEFEEAKKNEKLNEFVRVVCDEISTLKELLELARGIE